MTTDNLKDAILASMLEPSQVAMLDAITEQERQLNRMIEMVELVQSDLNRQVKNLLDLRVEFIDFTTHQTKMAMKLDNLEHWANAHTHRDSPSSAELAKKDSRPTPRAKSRKKASEEQDRGIYCSWCGNPLKGRYQKLFCSHRCANTFNRQLKGTKAQPIHRPQDAIDSPEFSARIVAGVGVDALGGNGGI